MIKSNIKQRLECLDIKSDIIEQLIEYKEIYKEMEETNHNLAFIRWFTNDIINGYSDFSKVLCNIT